MMCPACEKLLQERAAEGARLEATRVLRTQTGGGLVLEKRGTAFRAYQPEGKYRRIRGFLAQLPASVLSGFRKPRYRLAGALAAAAAVILLVTWFQYVGTPTEPYLRLLPTYSFQLQARETGAAVAGDDLTAGLEAYDDGDFERAEALLERAGVTELDETHEMIRRIYLGSTLAWRKKHLESVKILEKVSFPLVPGEWGAEAQWTLYVALKESGRGSSADSLLQILATKTGGVGERARKLLQLQERD
jgi:hypothetical protein